MELTFSIEAITKSGTMADKNMKMMGFFLAMFVVPSNDNLY